MGNWNQWESCSKNCGGGKQSRSRPKTTHEANGGICNSPVYETRACNGHQCSKPKCCLLGIFCGHMGPCLG